MTNDNSRHPVYYIGIATAIAIGLALVLHTSQNSLQSIVWKLLAGVSFITIIMLSVSLLVHVKRLNKTERILNIN